LTKETQKALLALEDGVVFHGRSFGFPGEQSGEVVFNTSRTGYQEILTDPSYKGQIVAMTYPLIGNYGVNDDDGESEGPEVEGFIVKEYSSVFSSWRGKQSLSQYLVQHRVMGVEGTVETVFKVGEGRPDVVDRMKNREIDLIINTPSGKKPKADKVAIRTQAVAQGIPCITTLSGASAVVNGIESLIKRKMTVTPIQEYHQGIFVH
jgi:hypothetical protein